MLEKTEVIITLVYTNLDLTLGILTATHFHVIDVHTLYHLLLGGRAQTQGCAL